jgi:hypothetical protein
MLPHQAIRTNLARASVATGLPAVLFTGLAIAHWWSTKDIRLLDLLPLLFGWGAAMLVMVLAPLLSPRWFPNRQLNVWVLCSSCGSETYFIGTRCLNCRQSLPTRQWPTQIAWIISLIVFLGVVFAIGF